MARTAAALAVLMVAAAGGLGWYYAGEILVPAPPEPVSYDTEVLDADVDTVTLRASGGAPVDGVWGLAFPDGYATVGEILDRGPGEVTRALVPRTGLPQQGDPAHVDGYAYPDSVVGAGFDFPVTEEVYDGPLGRYPMWVATPPEPGAVWALFVHGRGGRRSECFRLLPTVVERGITGACIAYRNDEGAPADPERIYRQGAQEWRDLEAAVDAAVSRGAREIVLVGYSMGGQITANFLRHSERADLVRAVVWDSPLLDWGPVLELAADDRGVPRAVLPLGMFASEVRADIDYDALDQVAAADEFTVPTLLFHGTADATVPVELSDAFAAARPDLVTYVRVPDAGHVQSWNTDPESYEAAVDEFLDDVLGGGSVGLRAVGVDR